MDNLLELLEKKRESALKDYNRYMKMPNVEEYKQNALLCRGEYQAYTDIIYHIKTNKVEV